MPPKQATLGKFLGKSKIDPKYKQQSTLAFNNSKKPRKSKKDSDEDVDDDIVQPAKRRKVSNETKDRDDDENGLVEVEPGTADTATKTNGHLTPERPSKDLLVTDDGPGAAPIKNEENEKTDEDDEDVVKKPRRPGGTSKKNSKVNHEQDMKQVTTTAKNKSSTAKRETSKSESKNASAKRDASKRNEERSSHEKQEASDSDIGISKPRAKASKVKQINDETVEDPATASEVEDDDADSEEEDQPEVAAKAREKVQSTLKSSGKDPYPDWKPGDPVPYAALCTTFSLIEMTSKRLVISAHCSLFLRQVLRLTPDDLLHTIHLMINKLAADYAGIELGIGESLIMKAIGESTGRSLQVIKADQAEIGDLGLVAAKSRSNQPTMFKPKALTVKGVRDGLMSIATVAGHGSQEKKVAGIKKLLSAADTSLAGKGAKGVDITKDKGGASEAKFIVRFLEGKLRLGLAEKTILVALAHAMVTHETEKKDNKVPSSEQLAKGEEVLKTVYSELPSYEVIVPAMLQHGIFNLRDNCKLQPGVPLKPMLAKPTKSITEVLDRFEGKNFTCEYKYDGERAQIHYVAEDSPEQYASSAPGPGKSSKGISAIFSRNSEDLSKKYPDVLEKLQTWVKPETKSFVLDCETVAWDMLQKKVLPFQQLMTRKRKDVKTEDIKVKVCVFAFDMLFYNGEAVVSKSFRERRELLHKAFRPVEGEFAFAQFGNISDLEEIQTLLDESMKASCEGLMVKMLDTSDSGYEPSKRSRNWLKVKKDYLSGVGDSLDLVVLGAYYGKGKRTSVYGAFLLACYNSSKQIYETVCNIGTGFSEAILEELHSKLSEHTIDKPKPFYSHSQVPKDQPDVWFEPRYVWEVKTADLTLSPRYKAGADALNDASGKGISLRFPRFIKERDDKKTEEATGSRMVVEMYQKQESVAKNKGPSVDDDFEY